MKIRVLAPGPLLAVFLPLAGGAGIHAPGDRLYIAHALGGLPGGNGSSFPYAVSAHSAVTGSAGGTAFSVEAFLWTPGDGMRHLGDLGGHPFGQGRAINELGHVVGWSVSPSGNEAFLWSPESGMIGLGDLPGGAFASRANGINDFDQVVGQGAIDTSVNPPRGPMEAFLWTAETGMVGLGDLPGGQYISTAIDINNAGQVVGVSSSAEAYFGEAFIWDAANGMRRLGALPNGTTPGNPAGINELGQVVVGSFVDWLGQPSLWDPETGYTPLGTLPGPWPAAGALALNDVGQVVGIAYRDIGTPPFPFEPFVWDADRGMQALNELMAAGTPPQYARLENAMGVNNAGQIVCDAWYPEEAVLLDPFTLGDMDCDGVVDENDLPLLRLAIRDLAAYEQAHPDCPGRWAADVNQDAELTHADLLALQAFLSRESAGDQHGALPRCPGDLDGDGAVSVHDLATLLAHFGEDGAGPAAGDLNGDGLVDLTDLRRLLENFGAPCDS